MKVLVVEDHVGLPIVKILNTWGHQASLAKDAEEAWSQLQKQPFDFLLVDWMLPGTSGIDFIKRVRQSEALCHIPILMISGRGSRGDIVIAAEAGVDNYIVKPFSPVQLRQKIEATLSARQAQELRRSKLRSVLKLHQRFDRRNETPIVLFGEPDNRIETLMQPVRRKIADYLGDAYVAIDKANQLDPTLNLGCLIATTTNEITRYLQTPSVRERIRLILLSTSCRGNSLLLLRLIHMNKAFNCPIQLVCEDLDDLSQNDLDELTQYDIAFTEREQFNTEQWERTIDRYILNPPSKNDPDVVQTEDGVIRRYDAKQRGK